MEILKRRDDFRAVEDAVRSGKSARVSEVSKKLAAGDVLHQHVKVSLVVVSPLHVHDKRMPSLV